MTQGQDDKAVMSSYGNYKNLEYTARIKVARSDATSDAGIIFRASNISTGKNALTGYYVGIDASQKRLYLGKLRNNWTNLTTIVMDNITANQYYKITVVAVEDNIKVYMDDVLKINVKDTDNPILSSGDVYKRQSSYWAISNNRLLIYVFNENPNFFKKPEYKNVLE